MLPSLCLEEGLAVVEEQDDIGNFDWLTQNRGFCLLRLQCPAV